MQGYKVALLCYCENPPSRKSRALILQLGSSIRVLRLQNQLRCRLGYLFFLSNDNGKNVWVQNVLYDNGYKRFGG